MDPVLVGVMGPTASGKSSLAEFIADRLSAVLVNADAYQCYRRLDIGTAKPTNKEHYRLLDIKEPTEAFGVGEWVALAHEILTEAWDERQNVVVVGGTGLYVRALFEEYAEMAEPPNPELRAELWRVERSEGLEPLVHRLLSLRPDSRDTVDLGNPVRVVRALEKALDARPLSVAPLPPFRKFKLGIVPTPEETNARIAVRLRTMLEAGWLEEVRALKESGLPEDAPGLRAIGYRDLWKHLEGEYDFGQATDQIGNATRQYAKRQRTWLRSEPNLVRIPAELSREAAWDALGI